MVFFAQTANTAQKKNHKNIMLSMLATANTTLLIGDSIFSFTAQKYSQYRRANSQYSRGNSQYRTLIHYAPCYFFIYSGLSFTMHQPQLTQNKKRIDFLR